MLVSACPAGQAETSIYSESLSASMACWKSSRSSKFWYTGKPQVGDLVEIFQRSQNRLAHLVGRNLRHATGTEILLHLLTESFQIILVNGPALTCFANTGNDLVPVELFDVAECVSSPTASWFQAY